MLASKSLWRQGWPWTRTVSSFYLQSIRIWDMNHHTWLHNIRNHFWWSLFFFSVIQKTISSLKSPSFGTKITNETKRDKCSMALENHSICFWAYSWTSKVPEKLTLPQNHIGQSVIPGSLWLRLLSCKPRSRGGDYLCHGVFSRSASESSWPFRRQSQRHPAGAPRLHLASLLTPECTHVLSV